MFYINLNRKPEKWKRQTKGPKKEAGSPEEGEPQNRDRVLDPLSQERKQIAPGREEKSSVAIERKKRGEGDPAVRFAPKGLRAGALAGWEPQQLAHGSPAPSCTWLGCAWGEGAGREASQLGCLSRTLVRRVATRGGPLTGGSNGAETGTGWIRLFGSRSGYFGCQCSGTRERTRLEEERVLPLAYDSPGVQWDWVQRLPPKTRNDLKPEHDSWLHRRVISSGWIPLPPIPREDSWTPGGDTGIYYQQSPFMGPTRSLFLVASGW